ncbi:MAG: hypothetical protein WC734_02260 [Patescibacteria group bacterium]|jgi:hypothetical protein
MKLRSTFNRVCRSRWLPVVILLVVGFGIAFAVVHPALALPDGNPPAGMTKAQEEAAITGGTAIGGKIAEIFSHFLFSIISLFGKLLVVLIGIMVQIAQFNNFTKATAVQQGWQVARDVCNLLLVIVLLLIAWGTVLRIDSYHYRRMLPKFILMAILINFSKSICGFLIDIAQVIMISFVNAFKGYAAANLTTGVGLEKILKFGNSISGSNFIDTAGALLLGLVLIALMLGAVLMLLFILLGRIIVLWILVVLSPVAYLGETIGVLKKAATTWWKMFGDYLVVGPLVAFFLWLAMLVISINPGQVGKQLAPGGTGSTTVVNSTTDTSNTGKFAAAVSDISSSDNLLSFILAVGMLFAASMAAQQIKTLGGGMGVAAYNKASSAAGWIAKSPKTGAGWLNRKMASGGMPFGGVGKGINLSPFAAWKNITTGYGEKRKREERDMAMHAEERLAKGHVWSPILGATAPSLVSQYAQGLFYHKGIRRAFGPDKQNAMGVNKKNLGKKTDQLSQLQAEEGRLSTNLRQWKPSDQEVQDRASDIITRSGGTIKQADANKQAMTDLRNEEIAANPQLLAVTQQRAKVQAEVAGLTAGLERISQWKPNDYYADQKRRSAIDEEAKKVGTSDGDRQRVLLDKAISSGNPIEAMGVIKKAFETKNQDDLVNSTTATDNYYKRKDGRLIGEKEFQGMSLADRKGLLENDTPMIARGTKLKEGADGLQAFMNEVVVKKLRVSRRTADAFTSEMQDIAESNDQSHLAGSIGMRPDGEYFYRSRADQQTKVAKARDKNIRNNYMKGNDKGMFDGDRLNAIAIREVAKEFKRLAQLLKSGQFNGKLAGKMTTPDNMKVLGDIKLTSLIRDEDKGAYQKFVDALSGYQTGETSISDKLDQINKELPPPPSP